MSIFTQKQRTQVKSNKFDLTHDVKLSTDFGQLTPICAIETLPGDNFSISGNAMVRLAPMLAPVMHRANVYMHFFFVPNRILWNNWENFITGGPDGANNSPHPIMSYQTENPGTLGDYFGIPTSADVGSGKNMGINPFPFAAYQKIYQDYYRDQNLIPEDTDWQLNDGEQTNGPELRDLKFRSWRHDYFTSALPWAQRGPEAMLPLGSEAPLMEFNDGGDYEQKVKDVSDGTINGAGGQMNVTSQGDLQTLNGVTSYIDVSTSHKVDLSAATAASIRDVRRALKLQEWLEKNARGGSRYIEHVEAFWGVRSSDKRFQRPEYIGGFQSPIKFSEVLQTSTSSSSISTGGEITSTPQGNMAGHGISVGGSKNYKFYAEEHGHIIGIMSVLPDTSYQQGIPRQFFRLDKFDYAWPQFAHIGEQAIENRELYVTGTAEDIETWGYLPRYSEYKFAPNRVAGDFRTQLDFWHMGRKWTGRPELNGDFVTMDPAEVERIFAVSPSQTGQQPLWCTVLNQIKVRRKLPVFGIPGI